MIRAVCLLATLALAACATPPGPPDRRTAAPAALPEMRTFRSVPATAPSRANADIAADFLDLSFALESGRALPVFTRFEGPVTVRLTGAPPATLGRDLDHLIRRLRREARIDITRVPAGASANVTIETVPRAVLRRAVPQAACFVVPRLSSWEAFRRNRRGPATDWTTLTVRSQVAIFLPRDASPQEGRDCLHEELAQALGPLNDLYRLTDSVFNDDNFHTILTGFDMLILRTTYAPELRSGMTRAEVAARLPRLLARLNPTGRVGAAPARPETSRAWTDAVNAALAPGRNSARRRAAARRAVAIARDGGWNDNRLAFSYFALGRLTLGTNPEEALAAFLRSAELYSRDPATRLQEAHLSMQLAAFALATGDDASALAITEAHVPVAREAQNAALLAMLLAMRAEALERTGREGEAARARNEAAGWARYGFGADLEVIGRIAEIAAAGEDAEAPT